MTSNYGKNKKSGQQGNSRVSLMFLPQFDVFRDLLRMATWNLFALLNKETNFVYIKAGLFQSNFT